MLNKVTEWNKYKKGEANCYSWKLDRVQVKITDSHYINNFVDHVINDGKEILRCIDKIILLGNGNPIAIFPKDSTDLVDVTTYLDSIKNTDIHTVVLSLGECSGVFVNSDLIEDVLAELNANTKIEVRYVLDIR
jgi:hypothetical protein